MRTFLLAQRAVIEVSRNAVNRFLQSSRIDSGEIFLDALEISADSLCKLVFRFLMRASDLDPQPVGYRSGFRV
jgi:hypothetical protein